MIRTLDFRTYPKFIQCIEYKFRESTERTFFTKHNISVKKIKRLCSTFISDARVHRCIVNILGIGYILFRIQIRILALRKRYVNSWIVLYMTGKGRRRRRKNSWNVCNIAGRRGLKKKSCGLLASYLPGCAQLVPILRAFHFIFHVYRLWVTLLLPPG